MFEWLGDPRRDAPLPASLALAEPGSRLALAGLTLETFPLARRGAQLDLRLRIALLDGRLSGAWQYKADLFDATTIERLQQGFATLLAGVAADPRRRVGSLPLVPTAERQRMLVEWNDTRTPALPDRCLHELFEDRAARTPDATAVVFEGRRLTY